MAGTTVYVYMYMFNIYLLCVCFGYFRKNSFSESRSQSDVSHVSPRGGLRADSKIFGNGFN